MRQAVLSMMERHLTAFNAGRYGRSPEDCAYPFPIHIGGELILITSPAAMEDALNAHRAAAWELGVRSIWGEVKSIESDGPTSCRLTMKWSYRRRGAEAFTGVSHRYISVRGAQPRVAMLEVERLGVPTDFRKAA